MAWGAHQRTNPEIGDGQSPVSRSCRLRHHTHTDAETAGQKGACEARTLTRSSKKPKMFLAIPRFVHQDGALFQRTGRR